MSVRRQPVPGYRGLTWDHPRGYAALRAAAVASPSIEIAWDVHSLEGFETASIGELARAYDLIVLDHPHLGDAVAEECLVPLDELIDRSQIELVSRACVGSAGASYRYAGRQWALPLDVAAQVMAVRPQAVTPSDVPRSWDAVLELATSARVVLSLAGPHALLSFFSIARSLGATPCDETDRVLGRETGCAILELMARISALAPPGLGEANPIALLEAMVSGAADCCPLVFGYVNYARRGAPGALAFHDAPGRASTLGGTGIAVTRRAAAEPALSNYLSWLLSHAIQTRFIPAREGQPALRAAWSDSELDAVWSEFYSGTVETVERAWVRPRGRAFVAFQDVGSRIVRAAVGGELEHDSALAALDAAWRGCPASLDER